MKKIKDFIKAWWEFILLCLIIVALLASFIAIECSCEMVFFRIVGGVFTMMPCGVFSGFALLAFWDAKYQWDNRTE